MASNPQLEGSLLAKLSAAKFTRSLAVLRHCYASRTSSRKLVMTNHHPHFRLNQKRNGQYPHDPSKTTYGVTLMHTTYRLLTHFAITLTLSALLPLSTKAQKKPHRTSPIAATQSATFDPTNTQQVIEYFAKLRDSNLPAWLGSMLSSTTPHLPNDNSFARATWLAQLHIVQDRATCERLQHQAAPVLKLFGREKTVQFFIYLDNYPNMQTIAASYLGVSTGLIQLLKRDTSDSAQFNALVAHELARAIHKEGFITAWKNEDFHTLKAYELFYDAVATATMNHLRLPSQQYALILERMIAHSRGRSTDRTRHPDLEQRQFLIQTIGLFHSPITQITISQP